MIRFLGCFFFIHIYNLKISKHTKRQFNPNPDRIIILKEGQNMAPQAFLWCRELSVTPRGGIPSHQSAELAAPHLICDGRTARPVTVQGSASSPDRFLRLIQQIGETFSLGAPGYKRTADSLLQHPPTRLENLLPRERERDARRPRPHPPWLSSAP